MCRYQVTSSKHLEIKRSFGNERMGFRGNALVRHSIGAIECGGFYTVLPKLRKEGNLPDRAMSRTEWWKSRD
jgi:hypothetical protein